MFKNKVHAISAREGPTRSREAERDTQGPTRGRLATKDQDHPNQNGTGHETGH